ncbi:MAG: hypothetical protein EPO35_03710 [Acidobacteria bacterium]|nr:MAG: hypothetical protein EPO35_03710 [Acidobacteriota bacterium]
MKPTLVVAALLAVACGSVLSAQDQISRWLTPRPLLTTGLSNTSKDLPALDPDEDDDLTFGDMRSLPRDASGAYTLKPGAWQMTVQSFCLLAGTTGPSKGDGYLYAPLAGPRAGIINDILDHSAAHMEIPQEDIQSLLWAILARARFSQLTPELQKAASALLTRTQIATIEADASERITSAIRDQVIARLPQPAAAIFDAESRLRDALATGASYEEQARLAVRDGEPEPQDGDRDVPEGRWSIAGNYLIRFLPSDYTKTTIQVMVPEPIATTLDSKQRIVATRSPDGWATEAVYDDSIKPLTIPGDPDFKGYAFKKITVRYPTAGGIETLTVENAGWTFQGHSNGKGEVGDDDQGGATDRYADWERRYKDAKKGYDRSQPPSSKDVDRGTDLKHYGKGVKAALGGDPTKKASWLEDHFNRLGRMAGYVLCRLEGGCDPGGDKKFKPGGAAVPGAKGAQRLGMSGR